MMDEDFELIRMHVVTKGGEWHCRELGMHKGFDGGLYLTRALENGGIVKVDDDLWLSLDAIASIRFTRDEVH